MWILTYLEFPNTRKKHRSRGLPRLFEPQAVLESEFGVRPMPDTVGQVSGWHWDALGCWGVARRSLQAFNPKLHDAISIRAEDRVPTMHFTKGSIQQPDEERVSQTSPVGQNFEHAALARS